MTIQRKPNSDRKVDNIEKLQKQATNAWCANPNLEEYARQGEYFFNLKRDRFYAEFFYNAGKNATKDEVIK